MCRPRPRQGAKTPVADLVCVCARAAGGIRLELSKAQWQQRRHELAAQPAHKKQRAHAAHAAEHAGMAQRKPRSHVRDLIAAGLVQPALECMFLSYQSQARVSRIGAALRRRGCRVLMPLPAVAGQTYVASVEPDGTFIAADGTRFSSPSAWAIHCKRQTNPEKRSDDGYRSIRRVACYVAACRAFGRGDAAI
jgi:hypothetical protein